MVIWLLKFTKIWGKIRTCIWIWNHMCIIFFKIYFWLLMLSVSTLCESFRCQDFIFNFLITMIELAGNKNPTRYGPKPVCIFYHYVSRWVHCFIFYLKLRGDNVQSSIFLNIIATILILFANTGEIKKKISEKKINVLIDEKSMRVLIWLT